MDTGCIGTKYESEYARSSASRSHSRFISNINHDYWGDVTEEQWKKNTKAIVKGDGSVICKYYHEDIPVMIEIDIQKRNMFIGTGADAAASIAKLKKEWREGKRR